MQTSYAVTLKKTAFRLVTAVLLALSVVSVIEVRAQGSMQLELTQANWAIGSNQITGTFKNDGSQAIAINLARIFLDIVPAGIGGTCSNAPLTPNQTCTFSMTPGFSSSLIALGSGHVLDIVLPNDYAFWFTVFYSSSSTFERQSSSGLDMTNEGIGLIADDWTSVVVLKLLIQNAKSNPIDLAASSWTIGIWTGLNSMDFVQQTDVRYDSFSAGSSVSSFMPGGTVVVTIAPNRAFTPGVLNLGGVYYYPLDIHLPDGSTIGLPCCTPGEAFPPTLQPYATTSASTLIQSQTTSSSQSVTFAVPPRYDYYFWVDLNSGDTVAFSFSVSSWRGADDVSFTVVSSTRSVLLDAGRVSQYSGNYTAVFPGRYYLRFDNSYSVFTTKTVSLSYSILPPTLGIETYQWSGNEITGFLRNYGASTIDTENAQVSLNGEFAGNLGGGCHKLPLTSGSTCEFSVAVPNGTWTLGSPYVLKLETPSGSFAFPVVAGGNSGSVIPPQPNLITYETLTSETFVSAAPESQGFFSRDFFVTNAFAMIGALAGGILLIGAILGLVAVSIATRGSGKGLYGEDERRRVDSRRNVPVLIIVAAGAIGLLTVSILTPLLRLNFGFASRIPYLLPGVLVVILSGSILALSGIIVSILHGRRKSLKRTESGQAETRVVSEEPPKSYKIPIQTQQVKRCSYCGAEVPREAMICGKCGRPAMYRK